MDISTIYLHALFLLVIAGAFAYAWGVRKEDQRIDRIEELEEEKRQYTQKLQELAAEIKNIDGESDPLTIKADLEQTLREK